MSYFLDLQEQVPAVVVPGNSKAVIWRLRRFDGDPPDDWHLERDLRQASIYLLIDDCG